MAQSAYNKKITSIMVSNAGKKPIYSTIKQIEDNIKAQEKKINKKEKRLGLNK